MSQFRISGDQDGIAIDRDRAGWDRVSFHVRRLAAGGSESFRAEGEEIAIIPLSGTATVRSGGEEWTFGGRESVFSAPGEALYLPRDSAYEVSSEGPLEYAVCGARCDESHPARLVTRGDYEAVARGAGSASRAVATLIPPEFEADRLLVVEVWTPAGNWSSYPPHKHDESVPPGEVPLEETYYYRLDPPDGFASQRIYSPERGVDESFIVTDGDVSAIPWGYHTTVAAPGYDLYYLNVLAGDARILAAAEDPDHAWTRDQWAEQEIDPRATATVERMNRA